jgi:flagellar hook-associated protein 1 FlgK
VAAALRDEVNAIQQAGVDLDGNSTAAVPMFGNSGAPASAGNLVLLLDPNTDPTAARKIAAALTTQPGDNTNALALADLRTRALAALGNVSLGTYVAAEQGQVGEDAARADEAANASDLFHQQLENVRQSISGVNLNEELTNLIKYQHAFQAASQVIRVADTVLGDLVTMLR